MTDNDILAFVNQHIRRHSLLDGVSQEDLDEFKLSRTKPERDWVILAFKFGGEKGLILSVCVNGLYRSKKLERLYTESELVRLAFIHSIKRLSDCETFTVGDTICEFGQIKKFVVNESSVSVFCALPNGNEYMPDLSKIEKQTKPAKDWQIESFIYCGKSLGNPATFHLQHDKVSYKSDRFPLDIFFEKTFLRQPENYAIHSARRLSDNIVFSVGDRTTKGVIGSFEMVGETLSVSVGDQKTLLRTFDKIQPLFTTQDGKPVYEGDKYFVVGPEMLGITELTAINDPTCNKYWDNLKVTRFSTRALAEQYVLENKPCLSLKEATRFLEQNKHHAEIATIVDYAKQKLNAL